MGLDEPSLLHDLDYELGDFLDSQFLTFFLLKMYLPVCPVTSCLNRRAFKSGSGPAAFTRSVSFAL
jgi:hypothetical protein